MGDPSNMVGYEIELRKGITLDQLDKWLNEHSSNYAQYISVSGKNIEVEFDELKIIQYWYDEFLDFLDELAQKVDGYIEMSCDSYQQYCEIVFKDGIVTIKLPTEKIKDYTTNDLRNEKLKIK